MDGSNLIYSGGYTVEEYNNLFSSLTDIFMEMIKSHVPIIGGLTNHVKNQLDRKEKERVNNLLDDLKEKANKLDKSKIDWNFFQSEEFARIVFKVYENARIDYREDKLKYYSNLLINYSTKKFSKEFYKEGIIEKISKYAPEHILILDKISRTDKINIKDFTMEQMGKEDTDICIYNLASDGLINEQTGAFFDYSGGDYLITSYGKKFLQLLKEESYAE